MLESGWEVISHRAGIVYSKQAMREQLSPMGPLTAWIQNSKCIFKPHEKNWLIGEDPWERLRAGREGDDRGWDGWMASPTQWTWVWPNSERQWRTGKPGVLQFMGLKRVGHNWVTEQEQQTRACKSGEVLAWPFPDQFRNFTGLELIKFSDPDLCYWSSQTTNIQKQNTNVLFYSK